jgi:outer membrane protein assembly factor BamA
MQILGISSRKLTVLALLMSLNLFSTVWATPPEDSQEAELEKKRKAKADQLRPNQVSSLERRMRNWEKAHMPARLFAKGFRGVRPLFGGMPSGSGTVFGLGYVYGLDSQYLKFQINGRYSTKGYTQFDTTWEFPPPQIGSVVSATVDARYQDYTQLWFYGLDTNSSKDNRSFYAQQTSQVLTGAKASLISWMELSGHFGWLQTDTNSGKRDPSLETIFDPGEVPGFGDPKTDYWVYGGKAVFSLWDRWDWPPVGARLTFEGWRYDDRDRNLYNSLKVVGMGEFQIPLGHRNRRIAYRFRTAHMQADSGQEVPFYLMETVGGANTIRGYSELRFRDRRNLFMNLEYRWEVWHYLDFAFFGDAGKAFPDWDDFDFNDLHYGAGWGIRVNAPGNINLNIDLAKSKEGFVIHIGGGPRF